MTTENTKTTNYVGKGKAFGQEKRNIRISFKWEDLLKLKKNEYEGEKYITLVVIPLKEEGKFGHTHTVIEHVPKEKSEEAAK